jgi:hypothetical protein
MNEWKTVNENIGALVCLFVCLFVCLLFGWLIGWLVGWSVGILELFELK